MAGIEKEEKRENSNPVKTAAAVRDHLGPVLSGPLLEHIASVNRRTEGAISSVRAESNAAKTNAEKALGTAKDLEEKVTAMERQVAGAGQQAAAAADSAAVATSAANSVTGLDERVKTVEADAGDAKTSAGNALTKADEAAQDATEAKEKISVLEKTLAELRYQAVYLEHTLYHVLGKLGVELSDEDYDAIENQTVEALAPKEGS